MLALGRAGQTVHKLSAYTNPARTAGMPAPAASRRRAVLAAIARLQPELTLYSTKNLLPISFRHPAQARAVPPLDLGPRKNDR